MPITTTLRDRLQDVKGRKRDLRDSINAATADAQQARASLQPTSSGAIDPRSPEFKRADDATQVVNSLQNQLALANEEERFLLGQAAGVDVAGGHESFLRDPEVLQNLAQMANSTGPIGRVQLGPAVGRDELVAMMGGAAFTPSFMGAITPGEHSTGDSARRGSYLGISQTPRRPLRLLDLFPVAPMEGRSIEYSQEVYSTTAYNGALPVAEGAVKPATQMDFPDAEAIARTIAHFTKVKKQQLADTPSLQNVITGRLAYGVMRRLENQIIGGDGTGENLQGITNHSGIGVVAYSAAELAADQTLEGIVTVLQSESVPNFVALNPRDWSEMLLGKSAGDGHYFSGGPFVSTAERIWNTTVVPSTGVALGTALVGDASGATVFVREGVNVTTSDSDQDDFTRNKVTLLGEGRFALAVWVPSAFAVVHFAA